MSMAATAADADAGLLPAAFRHGWEVLRPALPGHGDPAVAARRTACFDAADRAGLPGRRVEDWKFTSTAGLARLRLDGAAAPAAEAELAAMLASWPLAGACMQVIVDGVWRPDLSRGELPAGLALERLSAAPAGLSDLLRPLPGGAEMAVANLGLALAQEGALIETAPGSKADRPLVLVHLSGFGGGAMHHLRHRLRIGGDAALDLVELHLSGPGGPAWSNLVTDLDLAPGAALRHLRIGVGGPGTYRTALLRGRLAAGASYAGTALTFGGGLVRDEIEMRLQGEEASCRLDGLNLAAGRDHLDSTLRVQHESGHCRSAQHYRAVVDGHGHAVFQGRIAVAQDAQVTDAHQLARALLLSDEAVADVKPELEILADDVQCSHGASIGDLDEQALFYLRARGIGPDVARALLIEAFAAEILQGIELADWRAAAQARLGMLLTPLATAGGERPAERPAGTAR